jgi:hypothetical protein
MRCDQRSRGRRRVSARESDTSIRARPSRVLIDSSIGGVPCFNARVTSSDTTLWASFRTVRRQSRSHLDTAWRAMPGAVASAGSCNFQVMTLPFHESRCRCPTQRPPRPVALQTARSATRRGQMGGPSWCPPTGREARRAWAAIRARMRGAIGAAPRITVSVAGSAPSVATHGLSADPPAGTPEAGASRRADFRSFGRSPIEPGGSPSCLPGDGSAWLTISVPDPCLRSATPVALLDRPQAALGSPPCLPGWETCCG